MFNRHAGQTDDFFFQTDVQQICFVYRIRKLKAELGLELELICCYRKTDKDREGWCLQHNTETN